MIRDARGGDLAGILALLAEDVIRDYTEPETITAGQRAAMDEITADPHQTILVDERDGRLVATAQLTFLRVLTYDGGQYCQLESVRTASDLRGRGIGRELVEHAIAVARRHGCARVQLTSNVQRVDARRFYERLGFVASHTGFKLPLV
ncbi:GNAT family N-acetyltransferase [Solicola sp. PLA-1-18]|uniref:GNAT family N-acetyltransferase n=1 Tax=Solicola sp. PLA-1-18 TaxID=3380532 RepID=UPI003B774344